MLAEIAESHQRGEQDGKRQRHRDHGERRVEKKFGNDINSETFADKIVNVAPQELHQNYEQTDAERHHEQRHEALQDEDVHALDSKHSND